MMGVKENKIQVLPRDLAEKIAAGEVIERPASVIKELVENSIDAGARRISVEVFEGGKKKIAVQDDGSGIPVDQMLVALERHATSKIQSIEDLWNLSTMGFRGEALPSIAAVSRMRIESINQDARSRAIYLEGARLINDELVAANSLLSIRGTRISVEDLFFNIPARLKFLKSKSAETSLIRDLIERISLCNPEIAFSFHSEGRKIFSVHPNIQGVLARVAEVFETSVENIEEFSGMFEDISVKGWLDRDGRASSSRQIFLSVNGRMVKDKLLQQAVLVALRPRMMEGEYPKVFLDLKVSPGDIDVNVHPAKSEVRFHRARDVFQVVHGAIDQLAKVATKPFYSTRFSSDSISVSESNSLLQSVAEPIQKLSQENSSDAFAPTLFEKPLGVQFKHKQDLTGDADQSGSRAPNFTRAPNFNRLQYIGQLKNTYLLFQDDQGLVLVDQHAAHERVQYEKIKKRFFENGLQPQPLLMSLLVKCKADEVALALDQSDLFRRLGFEFEAFGDHAIVLRSIPEFFSEKGGTEYASDFFRTLLDEIKDIDTAESASSSQTDPARLAPKLERMLATMACHSSVRAGQALSFLESQALAATLDETENPLNCPHGRPSSVRLKFEQIEGLFKRV